MKLHEKNNKIVHTQFQEEEKKTMWLHKQNAGGAPRIAEMHAQYRLIIKETVARHMQEVISHSYLRGIFVWLAVYLLLSFSE